MIVYLGIGTNLGDRTANLNDAVRWINEQAGQVLACSSFIETEPWGFSSENTFLNAVVKIDTSLAPHELLRVTQGIEREMGRTHKSVNGVYSDRIIDIKGCDCRNHNSNEFYWKYGYSFKYSEFISLSKNNTSSVAIVRPIIAPNKGHGSNIVKELYNIASEENITFSMIDLSETKLSMVVKKEESDRLVNKIHKIMLENV